MDKNEFVAWVSKNTGSGGKRPLGDPFNKGQKGKERAPRAAEFPMMEVKERQRYYERSSQKRADDDRKHESQNDFNQKSSSSNSQKKNSNNTQRVTQNVTKSVTRNIVSQVAMVAVGSVVVVNSYQVMEEQREQRNNPPAPVVESVDWHWTDDFSGATVDFLDEEGVVIITVEAEVSVYTKEANCKEEGLITYTAKASYEEEEYTDLKTQSIAIMSHEFDEGHVIQLEDGTFVMEYECQMCHEIFSINISLEEE